MAPGARPYRSLRELPAEVWIDDQGLIRRMSWESDWPDYWETTELWDLGTDLEVKIPSPEEVTAPSCGVDAGTSEA